VREKEGGNIGVSAWPRLCLTCTESNTASIRVIEKTDGIRVDDVVSDDGTPDRRYLIATGERN